MPHKYHHSNLRKECCRTKKTIHYDRDGRKSGETCESTNGFGLRSFRYYDRDGRLLGKGRETVVGFDYNRIEYYDRNGRKTGENRIKKS